MGVEMEHHVLSIMETSRYQRTFLFKFVVMAAAALTAVFLLTFLDISLPSSKTMTSLGTSRLRNHSGEPSTGVVEKMLSDPSPNRPASSLRLDWSNLSLTSSLGRAMQAHQSDCSLPLGDLRMRNVAGLGSDLHMWTQAICNGMQRRVRVQTQLPWIFQDSDACSNYSQETAMLCYFPNSELRCPDDRAALRRPTNRSRLYVGKGVVVKGCANVRKRYNASFPDVRAAGIEYLFSETGSLVIQEAERQMNQVFGSERPLPSQLITVHIRWGDKKAEMNLVPIQEYVDAVQKLASDSNLKGSEVNIFLATEDPQAVTQFQDAAQAHQWKVFVGTYFQDFHAERDQRIHGNPRMSKKLDGRPGLVAVASLLIALQANHFVLTTRSNWSRLIDELRTNVLDPRCDSCTQLIDLTKTAPTWY